LPTWASSGKEGDFGMIGENIGEFLTPLNDRPVRCTASKFETPAKGGKFVHFNLAERAYIIGIREGQTKSSALENTRGF
jgi:hypothetical protein